MTTEAELRERVETRLTDLGIPADALDGLAGQLVWRVGRAADDGPVTVRVGFATAAGLFADLPKLRGASDAEIEQAVREGAVRVEWVGHRPR